MEKDSNKINLEELEETLLLQMEQSIGYIYLLKL